MPKNILITCLNPTTHLKVNFKQYLLKNKKGIYVFCI